MQRICYIILPEGLSDEGKAWLEEAQKRFGMPIVLVGDVDWNNDLTPWPAEGVFKKAKPFLGHADEYLRKLTEEIIPETEKRLGFGSEYKESSSDGSFSEPERLLVGVSLSGLFALWAGYSSNKFARIVSISGSMWYDNFASWCCERTLSPAVKRVFMSLGDREKNSKNPRMAVVEDCTRQIQEDLKQKGADSIFLIEPDTTHFSPILPRLQRALEKSLDF